MQNRFIQREKVLSSVWNVLYNATNVIFDKKIAEKIVIAKENMI